MTCVYETDLPKVKGMGRNPRGGLRAPKIRNRQASGPWTDTGKRPTENITDWASARRRLNFPSLLAPRGLHTCFRCIHTWTSRVLRPRECPACHTRRWRGLWTTLP